MTGRARQGVAGLLVAALFFAGFAAIVEAKWRDNSSELPGTVSNGTVIAIAAAGAAAVTVMIILMKKKGGKEVALDVEAPKFPNGGPEAVIGKARITNMMGDAITIKGLSLEGDDCFRLSDARQVPFTVAPGEQVDVTVHFAPTTERSGKGHLRVVASSPKVKKDTVKTVSFSARRDAPEESPFGGVAEGVLLPPR